MAININQKNGIFLGAGLLAFMFSRKLGPLSGIAKIAGLGAAALGVADIMGIFSISQVPVIGQFAGFGAWERPYGSYYGNLPPPGPYRVN